MYNSKFKISKKINYNRQTYQFVSKSKSVSINSNGKKHSDYQQFVRKNNLGRYYRNLDGRKTIRNYNFSKPKTLKSKLLKFGFPKSCGCKKSCKCISKFNKGRCNCKRKLKKLVKTPV